MFEVEVDEGWRRWCEVLGWWYVRQSLSSIVASLIPVLAYYLTIRCPAVHEWLHSVGFSVLGLPSVTVCYPTVAGTMYKCVLPLLVPKELGAAVFHSISLAIDFPYLVCEALLLSVCLLYLGGWVFTGKKLWFANTLLTTLIVAVCVFAFLVYPHHMAEWVVDVASFCGVEVTVI